MGSHHADGFELLGEPADAHAEVEASAGEPVDGGDLLRGIHGVALRHEADARPEADALGVRGEKRERAEGLEEAVLAAGRDATVRSVGVSRVVLVEEHHVLGGPQRVEAALLAGGTEHAQELRRGDGVGEGGEDADLHGSLPGGVRTSAVEPRRGPVLPYA
jgi:hypothetical protein